MPSHPPHAPQAPVQRGAHPISSNTSTVGQRVGSSRPQRVQDPERVLRAYTLWHEAEGHSRKTEHVYAHTLRPFFRYLATEHNVTDLADLELEHLRAWLAWLRHTPSPHAQPRPSQTIAS